MKKSTPEANVDRSPHSAQGAGLLPASEMIDRELVELALESHARALMYPDSKVQHDRANECANEILKRLVRDDAKKFLPLVTQLCRDLNEAHNEILRLQNVSENDFGKWDWPEWSPQANSIRWAERILQGRLAKTTRWTLFPPLCRCPPDHCLLHSSQTTCSVRERPPLAVQPSICGAEGADCQIAKVIPVGHGGACQYSVAIGSLGIKLFESLTDAQEVRDAINKAIAAAVSQGGVARVVPHQSGSSVQALCPTCEQFITASGLCICPAKPSSVSDDEITAIREQWANILPMDCGTSDLGDKCVAYIYELTPLHKRVATMEDLYDMPRANALAKSKLDIDTLLDAYDALKGENERLKEQLRAANLIIEVSTSADPGVALRHVQNYVETSGLAKECESLREELSRLKAAVPTDEVKEQDHES